MDRPVYVNELMADMRTGVQVGGGGQVTGNAGVTARQVGVGGSEMTGWRKM